MKMLTIVTMTFNCFEDIDAYLNSFKNLDRDKFDWIVIDAGSTDGTAEILEINKHYFSYYISEIDAGFYYGLNKALPHVKTPYYMVFGADDRPSDDLLSNVLPLLQFSAALVLGSVRLMPINRIKKVGPRWMHHLVWGRSISHHSVGTVIKTDSHSYFGQYDTNYTLVADGLFLKRVLRSSEKILKTSVIFGEFKLGGMSSKHELRSIAESFLLQVSEGANVPLQLFLFCLRIVKWYLNQKLMDGLRTFTCLMSKFPNKNLLRK
jgi:glycosyltransferase involved in cell wall biosynthesis